MSDHQKLVKTDDRKMNVGPFHPKKPPRWHAGAAKIRRLPAAGLRRVASVQALNFWLTNRIPRVLVTRFIGWYSVRESEKLTRLSIAVWRLFSDLDLSESPAVKYRSLREVFTRPLLPGRRPVDASAHAWCSPSDAIVGAHGRVHAGIVFQAKGAPYALRELLGENAEIADLEGWNYLTLRLTSAMYHRFHAPVNLRVVRVDYISGDVFNVNPPALQRIPSLFCRNERAIIHCIADSGHAFMIVAVAAILVASIQLHCIPQRLSLALPGNCSFNCDFTAEKGEELGWFEQGSTLIMLYPSDMQLHAGIEQNQRIQMGQKLLERRYVVESHHTPTVSSD